MIIVAHSDTDIHPQTRLLRQFILPASIFCTETQYIYFAKKQILYVAGNNEHLKGAIANESNWHCA